MGYWQHDRTYDHRDTEDCTTVVLDTDIGRYAAGTLLCDVLDDLISRVSHLQTDYGHGFSVVGLEAFIAPYDPGTLTGRLGLYGIDATINKALTTSVALDAWIESYSATEEVTFGIWAYLNAIEGEAVGQLENPIDADDTVIVITNPGDFPATCPYTMQIDNEIVLVVGGCGTNTLTVIRGYDGTTATSHGQGAVAVTC